MNGRVVGRAADERRAMSSKRALQVILAVSLFGLAFSGYLSYGELFAPRPEAGTCPTVGPPGTVLGYPACVYGFFMYLAIAIIALAGLWRGRHRPVV
jgi:uncharacterized membrane protein